MTRFLEKAERVTSRAVLPLVATGMVLNFASGIKSAVEGTFSGERPPAATAKPLEAKIKPPNFTPISISLPK